MFHVKHLHTGKTGEDIACQYLIREGYKILLRNYRQRFGEIDIVCRETPDTLIYVEVKTVYGDKLLIEAEDQMTVAKLCKFKKTSQAYALSRATTEEIRLDLITIQLSGKSCRIRHYKNIS